MEAQFSDVSRPQTPLFAHELLTALPAGGRVLDLGAGSGSFPYARYPALRIAAVDVVQPDAVKAWPPHVRFHRASAEALPFRDGTFDLVIANFVLEHVVGLAPALREADRVLAPGGWLYLSVPNAHSFEDRLYRALFAGGGHLQQFGFRGLLRAVYTHTGLKLMAFADWPAGFTFFEGREGLRQFTLALVDALRRSGRDVTLRSNFLMAFRKDAGPGYREVRHVCSYCGGGNVEPLPEDDPPSRWRCRACGRITQPRAFTLADADTLEAEMRGFWTQHPQVRPTTLQQLPEPSRPPDGRWRRMVRRWLRR